MVSAIGIDLTICTLGGFYAGKWLDAKLGGSGIWIGVSVLAGLVVGALSIALVIGKVLRDNHE
nr:AtpZ/AtpI family protein [Paenibacillus sp. Lou8.1]